MNEIILIIVVIIIGVLGIIGAIKLGKILSEKYKE